LADQEALAKFLGIKTALIPDDVEVLPDPKRFLISLAKRSRYRELREDIVPPEGSTSKVGPDYNGRLIRFVNDHWDLVAAGRRSASLASASEAVRRFKPRWSKTQES